MDFIKAKKGTLTKKFSKMAWKLLPADKKGWVEVSEFENEVKQPVIAPPTGDSKVVKAPTNQKVTSDKNSNDQVAPPTGEGKSTGKTEEELNEENSNLFTETAKEIKLNVIKDYLDLKEVKYGKKDNLIEKLRELLKNDVELLKSEFSL